MFLKIYFSGNQKPGKFPPPPILLNSTVVSIEKQ